MKNDDKFIEKLVEFNGVLVQYEEIVRRHETAWGTTIESEKIFPSYQPISVREFAKSRIRKLKSSIHRAT